MAYKDSIVALSSGAIPAGIAIIRLSGSKTIDILKLLIGRIPQARLLVLSDIIFHEKLIDQALVSFFPAPNSFTGEDCAEFHVHGSKAVVEKLLLVLTGFENVRLAEAGEFTKRAFENGKIDLVEAEGLADLLNAETETQREQALSRHSGSLSEKINGWREGLISLRAELEAQIDFSDEEDVLSQLPENFIGLLHVLKQEFQIALEEFEQGRIIRDGFRVAIAGPVNAGKSSLINMLVKSDLAIVSSEAGTTRDIREVEMIIDGQLIIFIDMAGIRETKSKAEIEGIKRAQHETRQADLILWLNPYDNISEISFPKFDAPVIYVASKSDLKKLDLRKSSLDKIDKKHDLSISTSTYDGISELLELIRHYISSNTPSNSVLLSRLRDKEAIIIALEELEIAISTLDQPEIAAHSLNRATNSLSRLLGLIDPDLILGKIFSSFCIGK